VTNSEIFRAVATRELSPEQAVELMMESDARERDRLRPSWLPVLVWRLLTAFAS